MAESAEYEVEKILNHRKISEGALEYKVRWLGWSKDWDEWLSENNCNCRELINRYWDKIGEKQSKKRGRPSKKNSQRVSEAGPSQSAREVEEELPFFGLQPVRSTTAIPKNYNDANGLDSPDMKALKKPSKKNKRTISEGDNVDEEADKKKRARTESYRVAADANTTRPSVDLEPGTSQSQTPANISQPTVNKTEEVIQESTEKDHMERGENTMEEETIARETLIPEKVQEPKELYDVDCVEPDMVLKKIRSIYGPEYTLATIPVFPNSPLFDEVTGNESKMTVKEFNTFLKRSTQIESVTVEESGRSKI